METNFILTDKINNLQKEATAIIKINFESKDYLVYSIKENEENCQVLASRLILNSEGMYFLDNLTAEEKGKLNTLIYNLIILIPTESKKGTDPTVLLNDISNKYFTKVSTSIPEFSEQEYFSNCSFAITNKALVAEAINFYKTNLQEEPKEEATSTMPSWDIPPADTTVTPVEMTNAAHVTIPVEEPAVTPAPSEATVSEPIVEQTPTDNMPNITLNIPEMEHAEKEPTSFVEMPTNVEQPQVSEGSTPNVAIVSDPTILNAANTPAPANNEEATPADGKKAGFAVNKFIVIGTICLVLAIAVVVVAVILIKQKTTGA